MKLTVKGWADFQHYKDRAPPWIKLHKGLLDNYEYQSLPVASRALAPMLWLLASESEDGSIGYDVNKLAFRLRQSTAEIEEAIKPLIRNGFLIEEHPAISTLADCKQDALLETEVETEKETEVEKDVQSAESDPVSVSSDVALVFEFWKSAMKSPTSKLDKKRTSLIKAALKTGYTAEQLCDAITGCAKSPFHMGDNDRRAKFNGLDLILRNAEKIDQFIVIGQSPHVPKRQGFTHDLSGMDYTKGVDEHGNF